MKDLLSRAEAKRRLRLTDRELARLIAERELNALRAQNTTKFRPEDIARLEDDRDCS